MQGFLNMRNSVNEFVTNYSACPEEEIYKFHRILATPNPDLELFPIYEYPEEQVYSSGYVLHTLEASFWCFLNTESYAEAVKTAVNLGKDTDTTGCVTGGLAGLYYGIDSIPRDWLTVLARKDDIISLAENLWKATQRAR